MIDEELSRLRLSAYERERLMLVNRFLVNVQDERILERVMKAGYDEDEHGRGWNLYREASGASVPLISLVSKNAQQAVAASDALRTTVKELDGFENVWFPRTEATLRRFIAEERRDVFQRSFFENLTQQPEGPAVVPNVSVFLDRFEALETNEEPGAKDAHAALVKRGLTTETVAHVRALLASVVGGPTPVAAGGTDADRLANARRQREAYQALELWYQDWGTTLRSELGYHDQVRLGLTRVKRGTPPGGGAVRAGGGGGRRVASSVPQCWRPAACPARGARLSPHRRSKRISSRVEDVSVRVRGVSVGVGRGLRSGRRRLRSGPKGLRSGPRRLGRGRQTAAERLEAGTERT